MKHYDIFKSEGGMIKVIPNVLSIGFTKELVHKLQCIAFAPFKFSQNFNESGYNVILNGIKKCFYVVFFCVCIKTRPLTKFQHGFLCFLNLRLIFSHSNRIRLACVFQSRYTV